MKEFIKIFGIIAFVVVIGFTTTSCTMDVPDENFIGTVGGIEFRVANLSDKPAVQTAFTAFLGADNGATNLANLGIMGFTANKVVITGVNSGSPHIIDFYNGSELRGKIGSGLGLVGFMVEGYMGGHVGM